MSSLYILEIVSKYWSHRWQIFSPGPQVVFFILFMFPLLCKRLLSLIRCHLFIFCFCFHFSGRWIEKKRLLQFILKNVLPMFSSRHFIVSSVTFRSSVHFQFIFVCDIREGSNFILLDVASQFSQNHLLKRLTLLHFIFLPPLSQIN